MFEGRLPSVLGRHAVIPVVEPGHGAPFQPGRIYAAPRDHHMVLEDGIIRLNRGPKEHRTRPAIDPLFVSAARAYGRRVVGVLLSGEGSDGVSGLIAIKAAGGLSLVQHPKEARHDTMPCNALAGDDVDAALYVEDLAEALVALASGKAITGNGSIPHERAAR